MTACSTEHPRLVKDLERSFLRVLGGGLPSIRAVQRAGLPVACVASQNVVDGPALLLPPAHRWTFW